MFVIEEELKKLPGKPGVYIMHDDHDNIIYVGKAISLKNRVRQYFQSSRNHTEKIRQMVSHVSYLSILSQIRSLRHLFLKIISSRSISRSTIQCSRMTRHILI